MATYLSHALCCWHAEYVKNASVRSCHLLHHV